MTGYSTRLLMFICLASLSVQVGLCRAETARPYALEQAMFGSMAELKKERPFGWVGATGLKLRIYEGRTITVEEILDGSLADGKFVKGEVLLGVNDVPLSGNNPFIVFGSALTAAEASDGLLSIEVQTRGAPRFVNVQLPVRGAYSATWPLNCAKSDAIVNEAASYYARTLRYPNGSGSEREEDYTTHGVGGALATLFLLSTGDDQYLPRVKQYVDVLTAKGDGIGDHTWDNGYNGIVCAEYFLRTGDRSVLPTLQYYCDNAKERQFFGYGWGHWGRSLNPRYVASGLMNPAGAQVATSLVLAKACGVDVDEETLIGALRQWYRFAGHGTVPYGDHRGEGGLGSNGKDGMGAAMMQAAVTASGDVAIYRKARDCFSMSTLTGYPKLVTGHADNGRGDGIWRGIASAYTLDVSPSDYHRVMNNLRWWFDLSRRPGGGLGMAMTTRFDDVGSGAGLALAYTAPRKTLQITGAPRSPHAKAFKLPGHLWGRQADMAFLSVTHGAPYFEAGAEEPIHVPFRQLGNAYGKAQGVDTLTVEAILRNVYHKRYVIRTQAAKALLRKGALKELEALLRDPDPRVRRAATDGMSDYRYWFAMGKQPIKTEQMTPGMVKSLQSMLSNPDESLYVLDGAMMALSRAPVDAIMESLDLLRPWTRHSDWWLRQSAFMAIAGATRDAETLPELLPLLIDTMVNETRTQARAGMQRHILNLLKTHKASPEIAGLLRAGLQRAVSDSEILAGKRASEGAYNVVQAASAAIGADPASAFDIATRAKARFDALQTSQIAGLVPKLLEAQGKLEGDAAEALAELLYVDYRDELIDRMTADAGSAPLDTILSLTQLRDPDRGWEALGRLEPAERVWRFTSFEPTGADILHPREKKRFRDVTVPGGLDAWSSVDFDDSEWAEGKAPIGKGLFKHKHSPTVMTNASTWGEGEFLVMRSSFEMERLDYDFYRLRVLGKQGFRVFLNGQPVHTYVWWKDQPMYRAIGLGPNEVKHLKPGVNHLAIYANAEYKDGEQVAQSDAYLEGLRKADLLAQKNVIPK